MSLHLEALHAQLGDFEGWPSTILTALFVEAPTYPNVLKVAAFFYGNRAPAALCEQAFRAFNDRTTVFTVDEIHAFYFLWQRSLYDLYIAQYYNIRLREYLFLNRRLRDQLERAPAPDVESFAIVGTGYTTLIRIILQDVRDAGVSYYRGIGG
jgi:hypothetical protein